MTLFDLAPLPPKDLGGRPKFQKTKQNQRLVARLVRQGCSQPEIAKAVGCSVPTLCLYFSGGVAWRRRWPKTDPKNGGMRQKPQETER